MAQVEKIIWQQKGPPTKTAIEAWFTKKGLKPHAWSNEPGYIYDKHSHLYAKVLFCLSGSIVFKTDEGDFELTRGDRLIIPSGVVHSATVGSEGVTCIEAAAGIDFK